MAPGSAEVIHAQILQNAVEPREEALRRVEAFYVPEGIYECVLGYIERVLGLPDIAQGDIVCRFHVFLDNDGESFPVAAFAAFDGRSFVDEVRLFVRTYNTNPVLYSLRVQSIRSREELTS